MRSGEKIALARSSRRVVVLEADFDGVTLIVKRLGAPGYARRLGQPHADESQLQYESEAGARGSRLCRCMTLAGEIADALLFGWIGKAIKFKADLDVRPPTNRFPLTPATGT
jgi:hypothetical protein